VIIGVNEAYIMNAMREPKKQHVIDEDISEMGSEE
jgi:hypothetical protein